MIITGSFLTSKVLQVFDESSFRNFAIATTLQLTSSESQLLQWQSMAIRVYRRLVKALEPWVRLLKLFRRQPSFGVNNYLFILMKLNSTIVFAEREKIIFWSCEESELSGCAMHTVQVALWKFFYGSLTEKRSNSYDLHRQIDLKSFIQCHRPLSVAILRLSLMVRESHG